MVGSEIMNQIKERSLSLIIVALGFAAGAVWKDAIVKWLEGLSAGEDATAVDLTIGAIVVTAVVVIVIIVLTKIFKIEEKK